MSRLLLNIGKALLALLLVFLLGMVWLLDTTAGARFAITRLTGAAGLQVEAAGIEGRLLDRLRLRGLQVVRPKLRTEIDNLEISWDPRQLFSRNLQLQELKISGVRIQDDTPPSGKPPQLSWPRVSWVVSRLSAQVERFQLTALSYRRQGAQPVLVSEFSSPLTFKSGVLSLPRMVLRSPQGEVSGEVAAGLWSPSLRLDLAVRPALPVQGVDLFSLQARLVPGSDPEQMAGPIAAACKGGRKQLLELTGELGMTRSSFNFRKLFVSRPGRRGTLTGGGSMTLTAAEPVLALALKVADLDLADQLHQPTRLSGTLSFRGTPSKFLGSFALANRGPGWQGAALASDYQGGSEGVKLTSLTGRVLEGQLRGALDIAWKKGVQVSGALAARGLNPGRLAPDWQGVVNLDLAGNLYLPEKGEPRGKLQGKLLESRLHGQELQGELLAAFAGKRLRIGRLYLKGKGFDLQGAGELDRRLALTARVSDLARLVPGAAGKLQAVGWVRWRDGVLAGAASGEGSGIAVAGVRAASLKLAASLGDGKGYPVHLDATLNRLQLGGVQVETASLALRGTAAQHALQATLSSPGSEAHLMLSGSYLQGVWRGELDQFAGHDGVGPFSLAAPAAIFYRADRFRIAPLVINGRPGERMELAAALSLHPLSGDLHGGWSALDLARANPWLQGAALSGSSSGNLQLSVLPGERVLLSGGAEAKGALFANGRRVELERVLATLQGDGQGLHAALDLSLQGGLGEAHLLFSSPAPVTLALPRQGDLRLQLSDLDLALLRPLFPAGAVLDGRLAGLVTGKLLPGQRIDLKGNAALDKGHLNWRQEDEEFDASLDVATLALNWHGGYPGSGKFGGGLLDLTGEAVATGVYTKKGGRIVLDRGTLRLDADRSGIRAGVDLSLEGGGKLRGSFTSASPARVSVPETGEMALQWGGISPALLKPWLPAALNLEGDLAGQLSGKLLPGKRLDLSGEADFAQGKATWQGASGEMNANLRSASLSFAWRGDQLAGTLSLALAQYGKAKGDFLLPVPARLPVSIDPHRTVLGTLSGNVQELGFLSAFLPGLVQESHGELDLDLKLEGTWSEPRLVGSLQLAKAGAYLPSAGIRLSDLGFLARLEGAQIRLENFKAVSGPGRLEGTLLVRLKGWQVEGYSGTLNGERFQTVYLPELQMLTSPKLTFEGSSDKVTLRGELLVPEMLVTGPPVRAIVTTSRDVIMEGAPKQASDTKFPLEMDGQVHVVLGDKVQVKASGINAQLAGSMDLVLKGIDSITSSGEIRVVKGSYKAYGLDLDIVRGRLYYINEPVDQPTLDILALTTVGEVRAGVTVAGYLSAPIVKLYSEPPLPEVDILAYMVLGHPLGSSSEQGSMVAMAASSLFSFGQSESLQEQIKARLGLSFLGLQTVDTTSAGLMGYKEIPTSPTGAPAKQASSTQSLLTVGKYLTPKLYLSYGRSLVTGGNLFMLRYDIVRHWQLETQSGSESGADIYYKVEFN